MGWRRPTLRGVSAGARELAARWAAVRGGGQRAQPVHPPAAELRHRRAEAALAAGMLSGDQIGAYSLSEPQAGSDAAALRCAPFRSPGQLRRQRLEVLDRPRRPTSTTCSPHRRGSRRSPSFLIPADQPGLSFGKARGRRWASPQCRTTSAFCDNAVVDARNGASAPRARAADRVQRAGRRPAGHRRRGGRDRAGGPGRGLRVCQRANDLRPQDHRPPGLGFLLADMTAAAVAGPAPLSRRGPAPRRRAAPIRSNASVAKLVATDAAMKVTTDAVQVLGGVSYTRDYRVERYMREAKITRFSRAPTRFSAWSSHAALRTRDHRGLNPAGIRPSTTTIEWRRPRNAALPGAQKAIPSKTYNFVESVADCG